jgi:hypothetical protein
MGYGMFRPRNLDCPECLGLGFSPVNKGEESAIYRLERKGGTFIKVFYKFCKKCRETVRGGKKWTLINLSKKRID